MGLIFQPENKSLEFSGKSVTVLFIRLFIFESGMQSGPEEIGSDELS